MDRANTENRERALEKGGGVGCLGNYDEKA